MVTLVILSVGIVVIFKTFYYALDQMNYLTHRLYANNLLDNRMAEIERGLRFYKTLPFDLNRVHEVQVGSKVISYKEQMNLGSVEDFPDVFKLDLSFVWPEGKREVTLSRGGFLLDLHHGKE